LSYGFLQFLHPVMVRNYAIAYADAALIVAMVQGVAAGFGTFFGGWLADHLGKKNVRFQALTPMIGCLCAGPLFAIGLLQPSITMAAIFFCAASFFHSFHYAPVFATIQDIMPARMRALAAAIMLFVLNLVGMGLGPMVVGAMSDFFTAQNFAPPPMGDALDYATACAHRVLPGMEKACAAASGSGLRQAMLIALLVYGWAALHYVLAARTLPKDCEPRG
jgi:MFS family permease